MDKSLELGAAIPVISFMFLCAIKLGTVAIIFSLAVPGVWLFFLSCAIFEGIDFLGNPSPLQLQKQGY